ncbi:MAG: hypothetical protein ABID40_02585 [Candidatus Bipolaricaulota bacterium]
MGAQHLVLDDDVHVALKRRKKNTGVTVREIGNSALRAALSVRTHRDLTVETLIETGKVTQADYDRAVASAAQALKEKYKPIQEMLVAVPEQTYVCGSWEARDLVRAADGSYQVVEAWAKDVKQKISQAWSEGEHDVDVVVLKGKVRVETAEGPHTFGPPDSLHCPVGQAFLATPVTRTTRMIVVFSPALPEKS